MKRILIIAAHPDDETLGCGGLISKYQQRDVEFKVLFLGEGSTCRFSDPSDVEALVAIEVRTKSARLAMGFLGIQDFEFHNLPCGRFDQVPIIIVNKIIEDVIRDFEPDTVFTHSPNDANNDHKIVFNSTLMATRPGAKNHVNRLLSYEVLSSSEWSYTNIFTPNYFEEISEEDLSRKWHTLSLYDGEMRSYPFPRSNEGVRALSMVRGMQAGVPYAEAFHLVREFKK
jgi:LmbE family N-acetylglucosaminyl deacetylase